MRRGGDGVLRRRLRERGLLRKRLRRQFVVVKSIRKRQRVDVGRQLRIDDELHRHAPRFAGVERLLGEAEAFGLVEVQRCACSARCSAPRCRRSRAALLVASNQASVSSPGCTRMVTFSGANCHFSALLTLPTNCTVDPARFVRLESRRPWSLSRRVAHATAEIAVLAGDAIDRHAGESRTGTSSPHTISARLRNRGCAWLGVHQCQMPCLTKNSTKIASAIAANDPRRAADAGAALIDIEAGVLLIHN